jgi:hypothetical protein
MGNKRRRWLVLACTALYLAQMLCAGGFHYHHDPKPDHAGTHACRGCESVALPLPAEQSSAQLSPERTRGHQHDPDHCPACQYLAQPVTLASAAGIALQTVFCERATLPDLTQLPSGTLFVPHCRAPPA